MHGKGSFFDSRLADSAKFPVAAKAVFNNVRNTPDLITSKLGPLHAYQLSIPAPAARSGSFDAIAAARGQSLFTGRAKCSSCHVPPLYTDSQFHNVGLGWEKPEAERDQEKLTTSRQQVARMLAVIDGSLAGRNWLVGNFSLADVAFAPRIVILPALGVTVDPEWRNLASWIQRLNQRASVHDLTGLSAWRAA